ncbi:hypothetical protein BH23ACT6_BH23ACT6_03200 [soil metagenome]
MSFDDLPADWPQHALTDADVAADVLDLCVSQADRNQGGLCVLALRADFTLGQPLFLAGPIPDKGRAQALTRLFGACGGAAQPGSVIIGIVHAASALTDADRTLHQDVIDACVNVELPLLNCYLISCGGVSALPGLDAVAAEPPPGR